MIITKEHMKKYVESNDHLVSVKKQAPNVTVLKYKAKVFYKGWWTPELCELRGTVVDDNFNIIQRPFTKIFNYGEKKAPKIDRDEPVTAVEKINGFMAAASVHNGELFISTTGSTASDFADMAREHISKMDWKLMYPDFTYIFEICDERDPHVIPEKVGAYLLGCRHKSWEAEQHALTEGVLDLFAKDLGCMRPKWRTYDTFQELKDEARRVNHEGFVIWTKDGRELKIKSPYYLVTKFFGRKTRERLEDLIDNPIKAKEIIDEEYYVVMDHLAANKEAFLDLTEQERFAFVRDFFDKELLDGTV